MQNYNCQGCEYFAQEVCKVGILLYNCAIEYLMQWFRKADYPRTPSIILRLYLNTILVHYSPHRSDICML
jgi:hypothetical protein